MADRSAVLAAIRTFRAEAGNDEWMTVKEVYEALKISDATFYTRVKDGTFPPGFAFSAKSKRWKLSEIIAWQDKSQSHNT